MKEKSYHFIGIGGIGMVALAALVMKKGCVVSGSDVKLSVLTDQLKLQGAEIFDGQSANHILKPDYVVISSAIREENEELMAARKKGIPVLKRAELLAELMRDTTSIAVAGAHGKTTTSSMIFHMLMQAGLDPTAAIGGIVNNVQTNNQLGESDYFVAEVDESDGSFLYFEPVYGIITNIDQEHMDFYQSYEDLKKAYQKFMTQISPQGRCIICGDEKVLVDLSANASAPVKRYGLQRENDLFAIDLQYLGFDTYFNCIYNNQLLGMVKLRTPGKHNVLNALACILTGLEMSIDFAVIKRSLETFQGVRRRFQLISDMHGIMVIDDYAHHPTEIKYTLNAAEKMAAGKTYVVFQPHRFSRFGDLYEDFIDCFRKTENLIVTDVYSAGEAPVKGLSGEVFASDIQAAHGQPAKYFPLDTISGYLVNKVEKGDIVLTLGAGSVTYFAENFSKTLKNIVIQA